MADSDALGTWGSRTGSEAPPPFTVDGNRAVPIHLVSSEMLIEADAASEQTTGRARLRFTVAQSGRPLLDLVPRAARVALNSTDFTPDRLRRVLPPDESTPLRMLDAVVGPGEEHVLEIDYPLSPDTARWENGGLGLGFFMTDLTPRGYLERHAPANLEFDQAPMTVEIHLTGTNRPHRLFTNGRAAEEGEGIWRVAFPDYFTCSSYFLHLTDRPMEVRTAHFGGRERVVPVTTYGAQGAGTFIALETALRVLAELEETFGPYAHEELLVYCTGAITGGMEYAGATMTSLDALEHEITHSWFARGVMPANGSAGWIDEALARWRDRGYPRATPAPPRPPVHLAGFSPYRRHTPIEAYERGSQLLSELDLRFAASGGLRPLLAALYAERRRRLITTPFFQAFLERQTGASLQATFDRYVYGQDVAAEVGQSQETAPASAEFPHAPRPAPAEAPVPRRFTTAELRSLL